MIDTTFWMYFPLICHGYRHHLAVILCHFHFMYLFLIRFWEGGGGHLICIVTFYTFIVTVVSLKAKWYFCCDYEGLADTTHVLKDKEGNLYTAVLGLVDITRGTNSFYKLQALEGDKANRWLNVLCFLISFLQGIYIFYSSFMYCNVISPFKLLLNVRFLCTV